MTTLTSLEVESIVKAFIYGSTEFTWDSTNKRLALASAAIPLTSLEDAGTAADLIVASALLVPTYVALSGDATIAATGALTIANNAITTVKIINNAITTAKITDKNVTLAKLEDSTTAADIVVANGSKVPAYVAMSGDATIATTGALTIANNAITTAKITDKNVTLAKLEDSTTAADIVVANGSKVPAYVAMSGDATIATTGALTIANSAITIAKIAVSVVASSFLSLATATAVVAGNTRYGAPGAETLSVSESLYFRCPKAGTMKNLYCYLGTAPGVGEGVQFTLYKNGVGQTPTVTISNADVSGADVVNSFTVVAGDRLTVELIQSGASAAANFTATWEYQSALE